ncbi:LysR substrate-binding domain-containing protein [Alkalihalobacillus deserti]|uniref:LysR substrate-binding domain-containing protein n=1 Tax=Alkalihalobacillus deserti TaxID=2879466 RepID=UPI003555FC15
MLKYAIQIILLADQAETALSSLTNLESGELHVGCGTTIGTYVISNLVIDFQKKHPNITIKLIIDNTSTIIEKLIDNKIDLAIVAKRMNDSKFNYQPFFQDKINAYCSIEQAEKYKEISCLTELKNETLILREQGSHTRECVEEQLNIINSFPKKLFELSTNEAIKQAILNNYGIGFLSSTTVRIELKHKLLFKIPLKEECKREFALLSPKGKYASPIMLIFSSFLTKNIKDFLDRITFLYRCLKIFFMPLALLERKFIPSGWLSEEQFLLLVTDSTSSTRSFIYFSSLHRCCY